MSAKISWQQTFQERSSLSSSLSNPTPYAKHAHAHALKCFQGKHPVREYYSNLNKEQRQVINLTMTKLVSGLDQRRFYDQDLPRRFYYCTSRIPNTAYMSQPKVYIREDDRVLQTLRHLSTLNGQSSMQKRIDF